MSRNPSTYLTNINALNLVNQNSLTNNFIHLNSELMKSVL